MLPFYAEEFSFTEINSTFYRLPSAKMFEAMLKKVPDNFLFAEGRLGALVLQFPYSFKATPDNRDYLELLRGLLPELPLVVEFRHYSWLNSETWSALRALSIGYVCVDAPRLRGLPGGAVQATSPVTYVRFHGRNAATWWEHEEAWQRYDYLYTEQKLSEWVPENQIP